MICKGIPSGSGDSFIYLFIIFIYNTLDHFYIQLQILKSGFSVIHYWIINTNTDTTDCKQSLKRKLAKEHTSKMASHEKDSLIKADDENHFPITDDHSMDTLNDRSVNIDDQEDFTFYLRGGRMLKFGRVKFNIFLSVATVISNVMMVISLPLFSGEGHIFYS